MTTENQLNKSAFTVEDFKEPNEIKISADKKGLPIHSILVNGEVIDIRTGTGREAESVLLEIGSERSKYITAMMSRVVYFNGERKVADDISDLPLPVYNRIQAEFAKLNF